MGLAGEMLTRILLGMGLTREEVYIGNVIKCRPPDNRDPLPNEIDMCKGWLERQVELINPRVIVTLGKFATCFVLSMPRTTKMGRVRGKTYQLNGRIVVPTWHTAYLLRAPDKKPELWADMQLAMKALKKEGGK